MSALEDWVAFQASRNASYKPADTSLQNIVDAARSAPPPAATVNNYSGGGSSNSSGQNETPPPPPTLDYRDIVKEEISKYLSTATGTGANQKIDAHRNIMQSGLSSADVNKAVQEFNSSIKSAGMREPASASYDKAIDVYEKTGNRGLAIGEIMNANLGGIDRTAALNQLNSQILLQDYANREANLLGAEANPNTSADYGLLNQARTATGLFGPDIEQRIAQAQQIVDRPRIVDGMLALNMAGAPMDELVDAPDASTLIEQLYQNELGRTLGSKGEADAGALDYWQSRLAAGATPEQLRTEIENTPEGVVWDAYTGLFGRNPDPEGAQYWQNQLATGELTPDQLEQAFISSPEFTEVITERKETDPNVLLTDMKENQRLSDLGTFFYQNRQAGSKLPADFMQSIVETITPDDNAAYEYLIQSQAYAEGLEALDSAVAQGDTNKIVELQEALNNEDTYYQYYLNNIAKDDNQHHSNLRKETLTGPVFGINDPKGGLKGSLERGIVRLGDAIGDVVENPYVRAAVTFAFPQAGAVLNAYATLDSGDNLSPTQIAAAIAGASELTNIEISGNSLISQLPKSVQAFAQAAQDFAEGYGGRAIAALKEAFPNVDTERLAKIEDGFREVVGDENIETISGRFADFEDLIRGQFGTQQEQLNALAAALAEDRGGFVAQRGYQPGLAVDTQFDIDNSSLVLGILNQPSTRTA